MIYMYVVVNALRDIASDDTYIGQLYSIFQTTINIDWLQSTFMHYSHLILLSLLQYVNCSTKGSTLIVLLEYINMIQ